jgi:hypothetical protein
VCAGSHLANAYWTLGRGGFGEHLTRVDALYLATAVGTTTGFGDVRPISQLARAVVTAQMISGFGLVAFGLGVALSHRASMREPAKPFSPDLRS